MPPTSCDCAPSPPPDARAANALCPNRRPPRVAVCVVGGAPRLSRSRRGARCGATWSRASAAGLAAGSTAPDVHFHLKTIDDEPKKKQQEWHFDRLDVSRAACARRRARSRRRRSSCSRRRTPGRRTPRRGSAAALARASGRTRPTSTAPSRSGAASRRAARRSGAPRGRRPPVRGGGAHAARPRVVRLGPAVLPAGPHADDGAPRPRQVELDPRVAAADAAQSRRVAAGHRDALDRCAPGERCCAITRSEDLLLHALNTVGRWRHIPFAIDILRDTHHAGMRNAGCAQPDALGFASTAACKRIVFGQAGGAGEPVSVADAAPAAAPRSLPRAGATVSARVGVRTAAVAPPKRGPKDGHHHHEHHHHAGQHRQLLAAYESDAPLTEEWQPIVRRAAAAAGRRARVRRRRGAARGGGARGAGAVAAPPFSAHDGRAPLLARLRRPPRHLRPPLRRARAAAAAARPAALRARPPERRARRRVERAGGERQGDARRARLPLRGGGASREFVAVHGTVARAPARDAARVLRPHRGVRGVARRPLRVGAAHAHRHRVPRTRPPALGARPPTPSGAAHAYAMDESREPGVHHVFADHAAIVPRALGRRFFVGVAEALARCAASRGQMGPEYASPEAFIHHAADDAGAAVASADWLQPVVVSRPPAARGARVVPALHDQVPGGGDRRAAVGRRVREMAAGRRLGDADGAPPPPKAS